MASSTVRYYLAGAGAALLVGSGCYVAYRAGQRNGLERGQDTSVTQGASPTRTWPAAQHSKSSSITLRAEHDDDGPYIVVVIPWHTLCASGLKLPQEQAEDCADAKASKNADVTYILPTDDDSDEDNGPSNRETSLRVSKVSADGQRRFW